VVGLGNPGARYERTRHNVGFMVLDKLAATLQTPPWRTKDGALQTHLPAGATPGPSGLLLAKPQSFMNESGRPVARLAAWWKVEPARLLIVYDDLDLPLSKLRMRASGSSGGHNGLKSIIEWLGTADVPRLRVGIGRGREAIDHVLAPFSPEEQPALERAVAAAAEGVTRWLRDPFERSSEWVNSWKGED
jgi:PTH1 family peptidyl-tRNA hydrolase